MTASDVCRWTGSKNTTDSRGKGRRKHTPSEGMWFICEVTLIRESCCSQSCSVESRHCALIKAISVYLVKQRQISGRLEGKRNSEDKKRRQRGFKGGGGGVHMGRSRRRESGISKRRGGETNAGGLWTQQDARASFPPLAGD